MNRTQTKQIHVGSVAIGGGAPVAVQSMCNTHTSDAHATIEQIARLHDAGCEIIRLAVPDQAAADALPEIVRAAPIPVVADIHFDYRLALAAAKAGVHKSRIHPGNIGEPDKVQFGDRVVGIIEARDGTIMDVVREVKPFSFRED